MTTVLDLLDQGISTYGGIETAKVNANAATQAAQAQLDAQAAKPVSSVQVSTSGSGAFLWIGVAAVVVLGAVLLLRR